MLRWLADYWYIPLLMVGALLALVFVLPTGGRRAGNLVKRVQKELDAIEAGRRAREVTAQEGTEAATKRIEERYQAQLAALEAEKRAKAKELEHDPVALAKFLERLTR